MQDKFITMFHILYSFNSVLILIYDTPFPIRLLFMGFLHTSFPDHRILKYLLPPLRPFRQSYWQYNRITAP